MFFFYQPSQVRSTITWHAQASLIESHDRKPMRADNLQALLTLELWSLQIQPFLSSLSGPTYPSLLLGYPWWYAIEIDHNDLKHS